MTGIVNPRPLGSFVRYLSCRLHHSIRSRHRSLDPDRTVFQGPGDCTPPRLNSHTARRSPTVGLFLLFRAKSISNLRPRLGDIPIKKVQPAQHQAISIRSSASVLLALILNLHVLEHPPIEQQHTSLALVTGLYCPCHRYPPTSQSLDGIRIVSLAYDPIRAAQQTNHPKRIHDGLLSASRRATSILASLSFLSHTLLVRGCNSLSEPKPAGHLTQPLSWISSSWSAGVLNSPRIQSFFYRESRRCIRSTTSPFSDRSSTLLSDKALHLVPPEHLLLGNHTPACLAAILCLSRQRSAETDPRDNGATATSVFEPSTTLRRLPGRCETRCAPTKRRQRHLDNISPTQAAPCLVPLSTFRRRVPPPSIATKAPKAKAPSSVQHGLPGTASTERWRRRAGGGRGAHRAR